VQTITEGKSVTDVAHLNVSSRKYPGLAAQLVAIGCSNPECEQVEVRASLGRFGPPSSDGGPYAFRDTFSNHRLRPASRAKPQPGYIPKGLRDDYTEACRIADLSPKASATLARRCIQGMIRDFCGISRGRLIDEINVLRKLSEDDKLPRGVTPESIEAIDAVRTIGNIGAHMEKDINVIVDVDPNEAKTLIELVETLFEDWYVARQKRQERFAGVKAIAAAKTKAKMAVEKSATEADKTP
jgi:hypothetical protein